MLGRTGILLCAIGCLTATGTVSAQQPACQNGSGYCEHCDDCKKPRLFSKEWYEARSHLPIGTRQKYKYGKTWPPYERPTENAPVMQRYHAAHYWPYPYDCHDRAAMNSILSTHISNGWSDATTLYDYHFDADTQQLTQAGILHLQWILQDTPTQHRRALVQTSAIEGANETRLSSVQEIADRLSAGQQTLAVELRNTTPTGRPAGEINAIRRAEMESLPSPRIKYGTGSSGYGLTQGR